MKRLPVTHVLLAFLARTTTQAVHDQPLPLYEQRRLALSIFSAGAESRYEQRAAAQKERESAWIALETIANQTINNQYGGIDYGIRRMQRDQVNRSRPTTMI